MLLIPVFFTGAWALFSVGETLLSIIDLFRLSLVVLPLLYWGLYFTLAQKPSTRWLMVAIASISLISFSIGLYAVCCIVVALPGGGLSR
ncbi:MAG: hypothetical protein GTO14_01580 [Anaerolineales bacterium]|nr:hypothetical protein [Anaerolineales bacterium]